MATGYQPWNRTPGKPSSMQGNVPIGQGSSWEMHSPNAISNVDDMWSNNSIVNRKAWPDSIDSNNWNNNAGLFGSNVSAPSTDTMGVWGAPPLVSPTSSIAAAAPGRGNSGHNRKPWNDQKDAMVSGSMVENCRTSGETSQLPGVVPIAKRSPRTGPTLTDLNAMLNTMNNNNGANPELDEVVKAIINVNDAWGQRSVDQSQPWDTSSIPVATDETATTASPTSAGGPGGPTSIGGMINNPAGGGVPGQPNVFSAQGSRSRMKVPGHGGSMESNVWSHEPPNGTGIWEAHYESLGERTAHWQQAAAASTSGPTGGQFPVPPGGAGGGGGGPVGGAKMPFNRQPNVASPALPPTNSTMGGMFRPPPSNGAASPWDQSSVMMMDGPANQAARWNAPVSAMDVNAPGGLMSRPLKQQQAMPPGGGSQRWSTNGQPGGMDSSGGFMGGGGHQMPPGGAAGIGQWGRVGVNKFSGQGGPWPQSANEFANPMIQHPPPQHPGAGGGPRMHPHMPPHNTQYQGIFRQNVIRQLMSMGIPSEDIQNALQRNNMDLEKAIADLREKSGHLGLEGLVNPVTGFSNQSMYSFDGGQPGDMMGGGGQQDYVRMMGPPFPDRNRQLMMMNSGQPSPTNPSPVAGNIAQEISLLSQRDSQVTTNISILQNKIGELNRQFSAMSSTGVGNNTHCAELQQQTINITKQLQALRQQQSSVRSQMANLLKSAGGMGRPISGAGGGMGGPVSNPVTSIDMMNDAQRMMNELRIGQPSQNMGPGLWSAPPTGPGPIGGNKPHRYWLLLKDIPPSSANTEVLKYSLNAALEGTGQINYEMHPNLSARWCLVGFNGQNEIQRVYQFFQKDRALIGNMELLSPQEAMNYLQEIQNLSRNAGFSQGGRWMQQSNLNEQAANMGLLEAVPPGNDGDGYTNDDATGVVEQLEDPIGSQQSDDA